MRPRRPCPPCPGEDIPGRGGSAPSLRFIFFPSTSANADGWKHTCVPCRAGERCANGPSIVRRTTEERQERAHPSVFAFHLLLRSCSRAFQHHVHACGVCRGDGRALHLHAFFAFVFASAPRRGSRGSFAALGTSRSRRLRSCFANVRRTCARNRLRTRSGGMRLAAVARHVSPRAATRAFHAARCRARARQELVCTARDPPGALRTAPRRVFEADGRSHGAPTSADLRCCTQRICT
mmetsp:Transcript_2935/g.18432  ORF Transcript_2935/g.18432 Transcript_2935/m.18432 type:complete len:237 (+) Transcript_2935:1303-2013(+)